MARTSTGYRFVSTCECNEAQGLRQFPRNVWLLAFATTSWALVSLARPPSRRPHGVRVESRAAAIERAAQDLSAASSRDRLTTQHLGAPNPSGQPLVAPAPFVEKRYQSEYGLSV